jgi:hypothetical protein
VPEPISLTHREQNPGGNDSCQCFSTNTARSLFNDNILILLHTKLAPSLCGVGNCDINFFIFCHRFIIIESKFYEISKSSKCCQKTTNYKAKV